MHKNVTINVKNKLLWSNLLLAQAMGKNSKDTTKGKEANNKKRYSYQYLNNGHTIEIKFSEREAACLALMLRGITTVSEIARKMNISPRTVENYTANMRRKLSCRNSKEVIAMIAKTDFLEKYNNLHANSDSDQSSKKEEKSDDK